jgi:cytochrome c oxidase assembly protein subunit 11
MTASNRANRRVAFTAAGVALAMIGLAYASVPLYRLFCQVTGFGGTTQRADAAPAGVSDRAIAVRFDANVSSELGWAFGPTEKEITVKLGEARTTAYRATNLAARESVGTAVFNVTPPGAGIYFNKIECFCFTEQTLKGRESADMSVEFFVDPDLANDPDLADLKVITLSYTMYPAGEPRKLSAAEPGETDN